MKRTVFQLVTLAALLVLILPAGSLANRSDVSSPLSVADLTAAASGNDLLLTWSHVGSEIDHHEVHRSRAPYFDPTDASFVSNVSPDGSATLEYPDVGRASTANYFYVVAPVETGGTVQPASNRVGIFNYDLSGRTYDAAACDDLFINEVMFAPAVGGHEWVELKNGGTASIHVAGCGLTDEDENWYVLPDALPEMPAGAFLVVLFDGQGASVDDIDFSDNIATVHSQPWLVDIFEDGADQAALYSPPPYAISEIASFVAWGADPGTDADGAIAGGIWGRGVFKDLYNDGVGTMVPVAPGRTLGLVPDGLTYRVDEWVHYQESEVTQGGQNTVPGVSTFNLASGATVDSGTLAIGWLAVEGASAYHFQMDDDSSFAPPIYDLVLESPSFVPTEIVPDGTYNWRVSVVRDEVQGTWSTPAEMKVVTRPVLPQPEGGAALVPDGSPIILGWEHLAINWQLQRKDTEMVCMHGDNETASVGSGARLNAPWDAPHDEVVLKEHGTNYCARGIHFYAGFLLRQKTEPGFHLLSHLRRRKRRSPA